MRHIFAIGGGEIANGETFEIDRKIVEATEKNNPNLLFIPTASGEPFAYVETIEKVYGKKLGCKVDTLYLLEMKTSYEQIKAKIEWADAVYVGGGDTKKMMTVWGRLGVDDLLTKAWMNGTVMSGLSAGSICWFAQGQSDSDTYISGEKKPYIYVAGIGIIPLFHCPHHNEEDRAPVFDKMVKDTGMTGIALENGTAIEVKDDTYRVHISIPGAKAYRVIPGGNQAVRELLVSDQRYRPLSDLV